jgi:hypothetical protein
MGLPYNNKGKENLPIHPTEKAKAKEREKANPREKSHPKARHPGLD